MSKIKKEMNVPAVTEAAKLAGKQLSAWTAVETRAKSMLDAAQKEDVSTSFAEFRFTGCSVQGIVKAGNVVLKIED